MRLKLEDFLNTTLRSLVTTDEENKPCLWIFGYGSLIWQPGFQYEYSVKARLANYNRLFYQGNTSFRGTPDHPGRVVTLVEEEHGETYGMVFKVKGWTQLTEALEHLHKREVLNGYLFQAVTVDTLDTPHTTLHALTCIASKDNALYLGPAVVGENEDAMKLMGMEIATASGTSGPNYQYLFQLADCMRQLFRGVLDEHLYTLESHVTRFLKDHSADDAGTIEISLVRGS